MYIYIHTQCHSLMVQPWGLYVGFGGFGHLNVIRQVWINHPKHRQSGLNAVLFGLWAHVWDIYHDFCLAIFCHSRDLGSLFFFL